MEENKIQNKLPNQEIDYFKIGKILLSRWYWIAGSLIICMIVANVYLWYTPKTYATSGGTMKFEEKKSEISDLTGGVTTTADRTTSRIQTETIVLQSTPLLLNAIKQLDYRISFYIKGRLVNRTNDLYPVKPLDVQLVKFDTLNFFHGLITFQPVDNNSFSLIYKLNDKEYQKVYQYNVPFVIGPTAFNIKYPGKISRTSVFLFKLNAPEELVGRVRAGFRTQETAKNSNIIALQETDSNPQFAADILNSIMKQYLLYDAEQRRLSATQMITFIDGQLDFLGGEVKGSANSIAEYKGKTKIMDVTAASSLALGKASELETQRSALKIELLGLSKLRQQMLEDKGSLTVDTAIAGAASTELGQFVTNINTLIAQRNSLQKTFINNTSYIKDVDQQILQNKSSALSAINSAYDLLQNKLKYLDQEAGPIEQQIEAMPIAERDLITLKRGFDINDKVYSFLSEKKLDAQINSAGVLPGATIIDFAGVNPNPVSPDEHAIHQSAITIGFVIGLGLIILIRILNPFIYDKETIESLTTIPILGIIRKFPEPIDEDSTQILAISKPRSIFAESVRSVRTNLSFLSSEKASKVICITSEVAGEGKSFVAVNLASTLSIIDKKVILIAADLRRSKIHKTFNVPNDKGLSSYLANQCSLEDIILHSQQESLDFIVSGPVPPNPSELLHTSKMTALIEELKLIYDVIMFDTAPIGLVSDAIPLIRMSDINIFVIRSGKSKFYSATVPQRIAQEYHLDNTCIILNAFSEDLLHSRYYTTKFTGEQYGTRYYYYSDYSGYESSGYYLDSEKNKWWNIKSWFKK
jgi:capsular exopolysaccharide synthesis family protein